MDAKHSDRSGLTKPTEPWVGIILSDIAIPARLLDGADKIVWRTTGSGMAHNATAAIPAFGLDGESLKLCFEPTTNDNALDMIRDATLREGEHRARNIVALALAIAHQSLGKLVDDPVVDRFLDRLRSLDAVARVGCEVEGDRCTVGVIARQVMSRFDDPQQPRIHLSGSPVSVPARWAHLLAIILHELGANAIRHGSLRGRSGEVHLRWCVVSNPERGRCTLQMSWRETGGAPVYATGPKGFGSRILRDVGSFSRRCNAVFKLPSTGLDYHLTIELEDNEVSYG